MAGFIATRNATVANARGIRIETEGLRSLRRSFRALSPAFDLELRGELRKVGREVAQRGSQLAPHGPSGRLAGTLRSSVTQRAVAVTSNLPYANVIHWGGSTGRGHRPGIAWSGSVRIQPSLFLSRAIEQEETQISSDFFAALDRAAVKSGWR